MQSKRNILGITVKSVVYKTELIKLETGGVVGNLDAPSLPIAC